MFIFLTLLFGMMLGWALRPLRQSMVSKTGVLVQGVSLVLLFMLGVKTGGTRLSPDTIRSLGLQAVVLAILGITGSIFVVKLFEYVYRKND